MRFRINKGFSLIELLIIIGLVTVLASTTIPIYGNLQVSSQAREAALQVVQNLRQAQEDSIASYKNVNHGVKFQINPSANDQVIRYQGTTYDGRDTDYDKVIILDPAIDITTTFGGEVNFSKGKGLPTVTGDVNVFNEYLEARTITINQYGLIDAD